MNVVLADDHAVIRDYFARVLPQSGLDIDTVNVAADGEEALEQYKTHHPDVIILDLEMPKKNGLLTARDIFQWDPSARIVVYSAHLHNVSISTLRELGVMGFVQKGGLEELKQAIACAYRGEVYYCAGSTNNLIQFAEKKMDAFKTLTTHEKIVALLLAYKMSLANIAIALHVELSTVKTHKQNVFKKLQIHSMKALYLLALEYGFYTATAR